MLRRFAVGSKPLALRAFLLVTGGVLVLLPFLIGEILSEARWQIEFYQALQQSIATRANTRTLEAALQDTEAAQRAFLLTGRQYFLDRYERGTREIPGHLQALRGGAESEQLKALLHRLEGLLPVAIEQLARAVSIYQQSGASAAAKFIADQGASSSTDQARATLAQMLLIERQNAEQLSATVREQAANSQNLIWVLLGGIIFMIFAAGVAGLVYFAHRQKTERSLQEAWQVAEKAQQEAEQANRAKTEFLTTMSHEIRTPLHSVIGSAEILLDSRDLTSEQLEYLDRIQVSCTALLNLVNDVIDLAKIEAGEIHIDAEPFSIEAVIDNSLSIVSTTAAKKGLSLSSVLDHKLPIMLLGDETRLRQVLLNLLGNAIKFTDQGSVTLKVEHRGSDTAGETLRFSVADTGPGIPANKRDRVFQRFSQISRSARRSGGTGLGLSISKQLVELMGGEMGFDSKEGQGSTFWFSVKLLRADAGANLSVQPEADLSYLASDQMPHGGGRRVLVVDDLDQNRDLARKMLEAAGYAVDLASNGTEALASVQSNHYEVILMDIQMDTMDGVTATKAIRRLSNAMKDVPIIAMTANVLAHDVKSFKSAGMNDHLGKPFRRKQLLAKVTQWARAQPTSDDQSAETGPSDELFAFVAEQTTIKELCSSMGRAWVSRCLTELVDQLELIISSSMVAGPVDRELVAKSAHILVSRAGILGFSELAQSCARLEEACKSDRELGPVFIELGKAARPAQALAVQFFKD